MDEPIRSRVNPQVWDVRWPASAGGQLVVRFGRSLDRSLVERCLWVVGANGRVVDGQATLDRDAQIWRFTPTARAVDDWSLHVHPDLEDLAGNSVRRLFDRDLRDPEDTRVLASTVLVRPGRADLPGAANLSAATLRPPYPPVVGERTQQIPGPDTDRIEDPPPEF